MYLEVVNKKQGGKVYKSYLIRENYREDGKVKHRTVANVSQLPIELIELLKNSLKGKEKLVNLEDLQTSHCREFGGSFAFLEMAKELGLDKLIYSRKVQWREDILAMIVGRILYQGSKLHLSNLKSDTALWELCGHKFGDKIDVNKHCYLPMDELLKRQDYIQKELAKKHLSDGCLILYDITNFWLEGEYENSELAAYGKAKAGKNGYKQIAVGLITNKDGCPVAIEAFKGNTADQSTVWEQANNLAKKFGIKSVVFAGDRGMLTPQRISEVNSLGFKTLTALTRPQIRQLLENNIIQPELFDENNIAEVTDPEQPGIRFMLCKNPYTLKRSRETRERLIAKTCEKLDEICNSKKQQTRDKRAARVGKVLGKFKVEKFFIWNLDEKNQLTYKLNEEKIASESAFDGCYIVRTDADEKIFNKEEAVAGYKQLTQVEIAFRNLKTVALELRPVYHKNDDRIRGHLFLCMLSYYIQWHAWQKLKPMVVEENGLGADRHWTLQTILERLKSIQKVDYELQGVVISSTIAKPDDEQLKILKILGVALPVASNLHRKT